MLPLRRLIHAAPDLATYPVQVAHSSSRSLYSLAYSPPSDLGHIIRTVQRILDSAPTVKIGHGWMDGLDHVDTNNLQAFWGNDVAGPSKRHRPVRNTL